MTGEPADWLPGRYRIERRLGAGGMGEVWLAHDRELGEAVAVKRFRPGAVADAREREAARLRFRREHLILSGLRVEGIVRARESGESESALWYAMDFVEGRPLREHLVEGRFRAPPSPIPDYRGEEAGLNELWRLGESLFEILARLHAAGLIHRDLKPANLLVTPAGRLVLVDFGLARAQEADLSITAAGEVLGSPHYLAPEQIRALPLDGRADLYAAGVMLYELACGGVPFSGGGVAEVLLAHLQRAPEPLRQRNPRIPPAIAALLLRLLAKEPSARPASAREALLLLRGAARDAGGEAPPPAADATVALPTPAGLLAAPYTGNPAAHAAALAVVDALPGGAGALVEIAGPAGAGKSRLGDEVRARCRESGVRFFSGAARPEGNLAGQVFHDLFSRIADHFAARPGTAREWLAGGALRLAGEFPALRRFADGASAGAADRAALKAALYEFAGRAAESPLVLWVDDLQWADPLSRELLAHLAVNFCGAERTGRPPIALFVTLRTDEPGGEEARRWLAGLRGASLTRLALAPLDEAELARLVASLLGLAEPPPEGFVRRLRELSGGNPYLATEMVRNLHARGDFGGGPGAGWSRAERELSGDLAASGAVSGAVREAAERQVAEIPAEERERLAVAAVIGPRFRFSWWRAAAGAGEESLLATAEQALRAGRLVERSGEELAFRHELLRAGLLASLSGLRRRRIHARVLQALAGDPEAPALAELIAHHAIAAGEREAAALHGLRAARRLGELGQVAAAAALLDRIGALHDLAHPMEDGRRLEWLGLHTSILTFQGRMEEGVACYEETLALARARGDRRTEMTALQRGAALYRSLGDIPSMAAAAEAALVISGELGDAVGMSQAERWLGEAALRAGDHDEARRRLLAAEAHARDVGDPIRYGTIFGALGVLEFQRGDLPAAAEAFARGLEIARACGNEAGMAVNEGNLGEIHFEQGRMTEAERLVTLAAEHHRAIGQLGALPDALINLARISLHRDRPQRARELLEEALRLAAGQKIEELAVDAETHLARQLLLARDPGGPDALVSAAARADRIGQPVRRALVEVFAAEEALRRGDFAQTARRAAACEERAGPARPQALALAAAAAPAHDPTAFARARALAEAAGSTVARLEVALYEAGSLLRAGRGEEAEAAAAAVAGEAAPLGLAWIARQAGELAAVAAPTRSLKPGG